MQGQWKPNGDDAPAHVGRMWMKARTGAGSARTVAIAAGIVVVVLVIAVIIAVTSSGSNETAAPNADTSTGPSGSDVPMPVPPTTFPPDGEYHVQVLHSGYCLGVDEQKGKDRFALMQVACAQTKPKMTFEATPTEGVFQIKLHYPDLDWIACLTLDGDELGFLYGPKSCEDKLLHDFTLEPVAENTYRIKSPGGLCMDAWEGLAEPRTLFAAAECNAASASQQFRFDKQ